MKQLYWDRSLIHIIGSYLEDGENGILNLLSKKYYNKKYKLHINGFILNKKMREWYCINYKFCINIINSIWAAKNGYLNCLKYAYKNGCPFDMMISECAASNGYLNCLKYLHENKCPWDMWTCLFAALEGHLNCLKYAHENGCPYNKIRLKLLFNFKCSQYINKKMK